MSRTIWLASYPKSGNTWFRMLVANLSCEDKAADINNLPERSGIAGARGPFDHLLLIDSGLLTQDEIDRLRPLVYRELARGAADDEYDVDVPAPPVRLVKAHDAYIRNPDGEPLLAGAEGADGAILIVRDPRDVAPSMANHLGVGLEAAIDFMNRPDAALASQHDRQHSQFRQIVRDWSGHAASWLEQTDIPVHLVRYEDMKADPAGVLRRALEFAGRPASAEEAARAAALADFDQLRRQEREKGFREAPGGSRRIFFRRGQSGAWREELTPEQAARIEAAHAPMMRRLGYAPAFEGQELRA